MRSTAKASAVMKAGVVAAIAAAAAVGFLLKPSLGLLSADSPVTDGRGQATAAEPKAVAVAVGAVRHVNPLDNHPRLARLFEFDTQGRREGSKGVDEGSREDAEAYYKRIAGQLGFPKGLHKGLPDGFNLDALLAHLGYSVVKATDLFTCSTATLMDRDALAKHLKARLEAAAPGHELTEAEPWDVLAAGYFSPKTTDVSRPDAAASWRRVVRLKPRPGSPAAEAGLTFALLLSVVYVDDPARDPFEQEPTNIQAILTRDPANAKAQGFDPAYFMAFDPAADYALNLFTATSWDATDTNADEFGHKRYFVPTACMECHGGDGPTPDINEYATPHIFDTDAIVERTFPGQDFERIGQGKFAPLYEAGNDLQAEMHHKTFDIFRRLNREIKEHNEGVADDGLLTRIAGNWWRLHEETAMYYPPINRAFPAGEREADQLASMLPWRESLELDRQLVPLLNRYCYRCHGSLYYNVLDRGTVLQNAAEMEVRIKAKNREHRMPPDRDMTAERFARDRATLLELLAKLQKQQAGPGPGAAAGSDVGKPTAAGAEEP